MWLQNVLLLLRKSQIVTVAPIQLQNNPISLLEMQESTIFFLL